MKALRLKRPGGLEDLLPVDIEDPGSPGPGQIRVRLHASSLNYHDLAVVSGRLPVSDNRIPMSDGAGFVETVGDGVTDFAPGDLVVSCFFPLWHRCRRLFRNTGRWHRRLRSRGRGRTRDLVYARTKRIYSKPSCNADHCRPDRVARLDRGWWAEGRRCRATTWNGRCLGIRVAAREGHLCDGNYHLLIRPETRQGQGTRRRSYYQLPID